VPDIYAILSGRSGKHDAGRFAVRVARREACGVAEEAVEMMAPLAAEKDIEIRKEIPEHLAEVSCDRERILQVFSNLIGNAIQFCTRGCSVTISVELHGDMVQVCVADTGPGIPQEQVSHVFDRYWQAERTPGKGLGLGLSITKGIVEPHQGRVWVESEPGKGSRFYFTLPVA
jgi:signal transduction histidine kinase